MIVRTDSKLLVVALVLAGCAAGTLPDPESGSQPTPPPARPAATTSAAAPPVTEPAPAPSAAPAPPERADPTGASPLSDADLPPPGSPAARWMREHFSQTVAIRNAVVSGKIRNAVAPAAELTGMAGVEGMPAQWKVSAEQLRASSIRIREGSDVQEVAAATADIGRACGHCHSSGGRGPKVTVGEPPAADGSVLSRMRRHKWAAERLWEGIYAPSDAAWTAGAKALEFDPFAGDTLAKGGVHARAAASEFNTIARSLPEAKTGEARGAKYAKLLSTCAPCHEAMGIMR